MMNIRISYEYVGVSSTGERAICYGTHVDSIHESWANFHYIVSKLRQSVHNRTEYADSFRIYQIDRIEGS